MSARASFVAEIATGLVLSIGVTALATSGALVVADGAALRAAIALAGLAYLVCGLARHQVRVGHVVTVALWLAGAALVWLSEPSLSIYVGAHAVLIWVTRTAYARRRPLAALADLGLCLLALGAAVSAFVHTGSLALASWCFFLVQALHVAIPDAACAPDGTAGDGAERFARARHGAETALERIARHGFISSQTRRSS